MPIASRGCDSTCASCFVKSFIRFIHFVCLWSLLSAGVDGTGFAGTATIRSAVRKMFEKCGKVLIPNEAQLQKELVGVASGGEYCVFFMCIAKARN